MSQTEWDAFINDNNITKVVVDVFHESVDGTIITPIGSDIIDNPGSGFDVANWLILANTINLPPGNFLAQITINDGTCGPKIEVPIGEDVVIEEEGNNPIALPEYICGDEFTLPDVNDGEYKYIYEGDTVSIGGFPMLILSRSGTSSTGFSGEGLIAIPFNNQVIKVSYQDVHVNNDYQVWAGTAVGIQDDPANYPDFTLNTDPLNIGGDICQPPPPAPGYDSDGVNDATGLTDRGFDPSTWFT